MAYPADITIEPAIKDRDRLTTCFRIILAIPHLILIGGTGIGAQGGLFGMVAGFLAFVNWIVIVLTGNDVAGIREFMLMFMRWRTRALAYIMLFRDEYPPFGDEAYPASFQFTEPVGPRDRLTVFFRFFLIIPHAILLFFVSIAWGFSTVLAWFMILFIGEYPDGLFRFGVGALRWETRVQAYFLLMTDEYTPFSLE